MSELTKALIGFHKAVDKIEKNARANYGKFADLANVLSTVTPALHANGLAVTQTFLDDSLITTLHHVSGETLSSSCKLIINDGRNMTQEWGKSVTFQRRYSIVSLLGLVADMDVDDIPDLPSATKTTPAQAKPANVKQAVESQAFQAGKKAIKAAKTLKSLTDLSKRVAERFEKKDLSQQEYDDLLSMLLDKESEIKEFEK
jgi:hypothetical protein